MTTKVLRGYIDGHKAKEYWTRSRPGDDLHWMRDEDEGEIALAYDPLQPRDPEGVPTGGQWAAHFPVDVDTLVESKNLGGSTGAMLLKDPETGKLWVRKYGKSEKHIISEHLANELYKKFGVRTPASKMYHDSSGKAYMLSQYIEGKQLSELVGEEHAAAVKQLRERFVADALLGNWDVIGASQDNIVVDAQGRVWRIDNGGALEYRAQGSPKGAAWNAAVGEIDTMRAPSNDAGKVFAGITNEEISKQVTALANKASEHEHSLPPMVKQRLQTLIDKYESEPVHAASKHAEVTKPPHATWLGETKEEQLKVLSAKLKHIETLTQKDLKKIVMVNAVSGNDPDKLLVHHTITDVEHAAIKVAFPDKKLVKVIPTKLLKDQLESTGSKTFMQLWQKSFHEPGSMPLPKGVKPKPVYKGTLTAKEQELNDIVMSIPHSQFRSQKIGFWDAVDAQFSAKYSDKKFERAPLRSYEPATFTHSPRDYDVTDPAYKAWLEKVGEKGSFHSAISKWKGDPFAIQAAEFSGNGSSKASSFNKALDTCPVTFEGVLYRGLHGVGVGTHAYEQFATPGNVVVFNSSQGGARRPGAAVNFALGREGILLRVVVRTAKPIEDVGGFENEEENIMRKGTVYRVAAVAHNVHLVKEPGGKGKVIPLVVDLEEITRVKKK